MTSVLLYVVESQDCLWLCYQILRTLASPPQLRMLDVGPGITGMISPTGEADAGPCGDSASCAHYSMWDLKTSSSSTDLAINPASCALPQTV